MSMIRYQIIVSSSYQSLLFYLWLVCLLDELGTNMTNWWDNTENQIAFSRGNKGFIAINNEDRPLTATVAVSTFE